MGELRGGEARGTQSVFPGQNLAEVVEYEYPKLQILTGAEPIEPTNKTLKSGKAGNTYGKVSES